METPSPGARDDQVRDVAAAPDLHLDDTIDAVLVTHEDGLRAATVGLARSRRVALDIESNGLFKYRATLCAMQLAGTKSTEAANVFIVDTFTTSLEPLSELLGPNGPRKIVHDVAFDARILAESGLILANVLDTSIAARMLGRTATGLASLLGAELGIELDKKLQHHDWTERPIRPNQLRYLANDVIHLEALADKLWAEVEARDIAAEIEEETRYRLSQSIAAAGSVDPRRPYLRLKGIDRAPATQLPILRRLADVREEKARKLDVPPHKVLGADVLFAIARARPRTMAELEGVCGATQGHRARSLAPQLLEAVHAGLADDGVPEAERAMLDKPRLPPAVAKARRAREQRLTSWRKNEAKRRGVDEQVVLPGHCLNDLASLDDDASIDSIARVPGIGAFRVERLGETLRTVLTAPPVLPSSDAAEGI